MRGSGRALDDRGLGRERGRPEGPRAAAQRRVLDHAAEVNARLVPAGDRFLGATVPASRTTLRELAFALPLINDARVLPGSRARCTSALTDLDSPPVRYGGGRPATETAEHHSALHAQRWIQAEVQSVARPPGGRSSCGVVG